MSNDFKKLMEASKKRRERERSRPLSESEKRSQDNALKVGIWAVVGVIFTAFHWADPVDDAYVSFVYVKNLIAGHGLALNPGEKIADCSNFLWVMLTWLGSFTAPIPDAAQYMGFLLGAANTTMVYFVARRSGIGKLAIIAAALYATDLSASIWNVEGIETPLYTFFILMSLHLYLRDRSKGLWGLPALLAAMTRPEGAAVFLSIAAHRCLDLIRKKSPIDRKDFVAAAIFALGLGAYGAWRHSYFGNILPNIFHLESGFKTPLSGMLYIVKSLWIGRPVGIILVIFLAVLGLAINTRRMALREDGAVLKLGAILAWLAVGVTIIVITGGDWMPNGRLLVPLFPAIYILCANGLRFFKRPLHYYLLVTAIIGTNIVGQSLYGQGNSSDKRWAREQASFYMPVADWLNKQKASGKKVALSELGYITYNTNIRAIRADDIDRVMALEPEYIIRMERNYGAGKIQGHTAFDRAVIEDSRFISDYIQAASIPGFEATANSMGDKDRDYTVTFKIYRKSDR